MAIIVLQRLGALEKKLLSDEFSESDVELSSDLEPWSGSRYVSIIKNVGDQIGGSLPHGHQQIIMSTLMPRRIKEDLLFLQSHGVPFSDFILSHTADSLIIRDYGPSVLLVPYFMRRPYDMMLCLRNTTRAYIHELSLDEVRVVVAGWKDAISAITKVMATFGRDLAYNVITHNGPGRGLYFEFLPYTQESGGFEQLGLVSCQSDPYQAASLIRELI